MFVSSTVKLWIGHQTLYFLIMVENCDNILSDVCRACLTNSCIEMKSLVDNDLSMKFASCTSLKIQQDDVLPHKLCAKCTNFILQWSDFKKRCEQSEFILLKQLEQTKVDLEMPVSETKYENIISNITPLKSEEEDIKCEIDDYIPYESDNAYEKDDFIDSDDEKLIFIKEKYSNKKPTFTSLNGKRTLRQNGGQCSMCQKIFSYNRALKSHLTTCGRDGRQVKIYNPQTAEKKLMPKSDALLCGICNTKSGSLPELKKHLNAHRESNNLSCQLCNITAADFADLVCHRYKHQEKGYSMRIQCFICSKKFGKEDRLEFHFRGIHLNKTPGLCKVCGKTFMNFKNWKFHKLLHTGVKVECHMCLKNFSNKRSLINHLKCHSETKEYVCHLCGFACKLPAGLASHHFRMHSNNQPLPCDHCGKKFKNKETLREHLLRVTSERNYECQHCGKKYRSEKELACHEKWHSNLKPFVCAQCGKSYKCNTHLKNHLRQHTGERPFECTICCNSFKTSSVLKKHLMIHSGERPHMCQHCGKSFIEKSNLKNHMKTHKSIANNINF